MQQLPTTSTSNSTQWSVEPAACVPDIQVSVIDQPDDFKVLEGTWDRLLSNDQRGCVFMSWQWHFTWWEVYANPLDKLQIALFCIDGEIVGLLPMYSRRQYLLRRSTLRFIGTGEAHEDEVATEYLDVLAVTEKQEHVAAAAAEWLLGFTAWRGVELKCVLDDALLLAALRRRQSLGNRLERFVGARYRVDLSGNERWYLGRLSPSKQRRIARSRRALEGEGGLQPSSVQSLCQQNKAFNDLSDLNHERQHKKRRKSVFASKRFGQFHSDLFARLYTKDAVNIHQFKLDGKLLAVLYCFYDDDTCYYYQSGFVESGANKFMPLTFAHLAEMQRCRVKGLRHYDFMRGQPPSYKDELGCTTTPMLNILLFRSGWCKAGFTWIYARRREVAALLRKAGVRR